MRESSENRRKREEEAEEARSAEERKKKILQVSKSDLSGRDLLRALVRNVLISQDWISVLVESSFCSTLRKKEEAYEDSETKAVLLERPRSTVFKDSPRVRRSLERLVGVGSEWFWSKSFFQP